MIWDSFSFSGGHSKALSQGKVSFLDSLKECKESEDAVEEKRDIKEHWGRRGEEMQLLGGNGHF